MESGSEAADGGGGGRGGGRGGWSIFHSRRALLGVAGEKGKGEGEICWGGEWYITLSKTMAGSQLFFVRAHDPTLQRTTIRLTPRGRNTRPGPPPPWPATPSQSDGFFPRQILERGRFAGTNG